ncbi:MAG: YHS domain-containing protein [Thermodesulfobacteriota bacterium]|nr:YHS domain-containing protein [Thermodesulfobacteriota bacterium]
MRLLIYIILIFVVYQIYKAVRRELGRPEQVNRKKDDSAITAELVEDPVCHAYCPKNEAVTAVMDGKSYYFCSEKCKQKFMEENNHRVHRER